MDRIASQHFASARSVATFSPMTCACSDRCDFVNRQYDPSSRPCKWHYTERARENTASLLYGWGPFDAVLASTILAALGSVEDDVSSTWYARSRPCKVNTVLSLLQPNAVVTRDPADDVIMAVTLKMFRVRLIFLASLTTLFTTKW